ncbi:MAG TPA: iron ABC transporter permease [Solirubrobacteraceae bacterium]|nr:iron ABC transporter permease [Solirubrobacteraceae bacterium]
MSSAAGRVSSAWHARPGRHTGAGRVVWGIVLCVVVGVFTVLPAAWVIINSFNSAPPGDSFAFSTDGWSDIFSDPTTVKSIGYTFLLSLRIPIAMAIALAMTWAIVRMDLPARKFIERCLWLAFFLPALPVTLGWLLLADPDYGLINKLLHSLPLLGGVTLSITSVAGIMWVYISLTTVPIMVILLSASLRQIDASYEEASEASGASVPKTMRRVTFRLLLPAILTALVAGFITSLEVFEVEQILGTPVGIRVYSTQIFSYVGSVPPLYAQALALGTLFFFVLLVIAVAYQIQVKRAGAHATMTGSGSRVARRPRTRAAYVVSGLMLLYIAIGVALPVIVLILGSFSKLFGFFFIDSPWTTAHWSQVLHSSDFTTAARNSVIVGLGVGIVGTLLYALLAWTMVRTRIWGRSLIGVMVWLPWAIPGVLAGVAWLVIFLRVPGLSSLYGTLTPLVIVLVVKGLPLGTQMLRTSVEQVSEDLEAAARASGAGFARTFRTVTLPLISPMVVSVFMILFMTSMRDVSSVVLLAPPETRTLSLLMFSYATSGQLESSAVIGVMLAVLAMFVAGFASRIGLRMNMGQEA